MTENAKTRQIFYFEMAPKATTLFHTTFQIILIHSVCREEIFCREQAYQSLSYVRKGGGGVNFQLCPLLGPHGILTGPNWHMHNLAMGPTI